MREIGVGPSLLVENRGCANVLTTTTAKDVMNAFFFDHKGSMAGLGFKRSPKYPDSS